MGVKFTRGIIMKFDFMYIALSVVLLFTVAVALYRADYHCAGAWLCASLLALRGAIK